MRWSILNAEASHRSEPSKQNAKGVGSMRHQEKIKIQRRRRRKLFWLFAAAAVLALLLEEQAAVLYVLSTLAICGLLMVRAFSNLAARDKDKQTVGIREAANEMNTNSRALASATYRGSILTAERELRWPIEQRS